MTTKPVYSTAVCCARDVIADLRIESPEEILIGKIAAFKGAPIRYAELSGCDGRMIRSDHSAIITVNSAIARLGQRRLIIAHELGHVLLHPTIRQMEDVSIRQTQNFSLRQEPEEMEANYFAAELLMPKIFFAKDAISTDPDWHSIGTLAERYQTTRSSTAIQYLHSTKEAVFLVASEGGERTWFSISDSGRDFYLNDAQRLHRYSCAHELLAEGKTRSHSNVPAGAWLRGYDSDGKETIVEDSMRASGSNFILTLLWVRDSI